MPVTNTNSEKELPLENSVTILKKQVPLKQGVIKKNTYPASLDHSVPGSVTVNIDTNSAPDMENVTQKPVKKYNYTTKDELLKKLAANSELRKKKNTQQPVKKNLPVEKPVKKNTYTTKDELLKKLALSRKVKKPCKDKVKTRCATILKNTTLYPFTYYRGSFLCLYCRVKFPDMAQVEEHVKQHDSISEDDIYTALIKYSTTELIKINVREYGCKICEAVLDDFDALKQHLADNHDLKDSAESDGIALYKMGKDNFNCAHCSQQFTTYRLLNIHIKEHYMKFICDQCGSGFINSTGLTTHLKSHESGSYPCVECGKIYKNEICRDEHYKSVHAGTKSACSICGKGFHSYYQRLKHMKDVHNADMPEYRCTFCPKVFLMISYWKDHEKSHLKTTTNTCPICDHKFYNKSSLRRHMIVHSGEKPHKCDICGKAYARKNRLKEHQKLHIDDKEYIYNLNMPHVQ